MHGAGRDTESARRATRSARKDVLKKIDDEGVEFVLLWFTDIEGHLKSFAVTPSEIEGALDDGMGFDGSSITGFNAIEESDMVAIPDPNTYQLMPWREGETKVGRMICDVVTPDGKPYEGDPRYVLRRALERMESMGFDTFNVGPELEYFLFKDNKGTETLDEGGYFAMTTLDAATELRAANGAPLESMGIPIEYVHHEVGPSQHEIDMRFAPALTMADHTVTYRLIVKEVAKKAGFHATFMPKPIFGENGSGMHTHQSLFKDGRNAFFDGDDDWHLSDVGKGFIAGQLRHAREISAVCRAVGELVQAARPRVRGAGVRRVVAAKPLCADSHPAVQARRRAGNACGDPLPGSGVQSVPHVRDAPARGPGGHRAGLRAPRPDGDQPVPPDGGAANGAGHRRAAGDARRGDHGAIALRVGAQGSRPAHLRPLRRAEAKGMGRVQGPALAVGDGQVPRGALTVRRQGGSAALPADGRARPRRPQGAFAPAVGRQSTPVAAMRRSLVQCNSFAEIRKAF